MSAPTGDDGHPVSAQWTAWRQRVDLEEYDRRWEQMAAAGQAPHGEADFVMGLSPRSVLDAGCGMGRLAIELRRRGVEAVGVDLDDELLVYARRHAPHVEWVHADLATMNLGRTFDVVVMAGNVMNFCRPADRAAIVERAAGHLAAGGRLVAGFTLEAAGAGGDALTLEEYDRLASHASLVLSERWATWERTVWADGGDYAVSVHTLTSRR